MNDRLNAAIEHVARDRYMRTADGRQFPQTSKPELVATMLRLLDVQPATACWRSAPARATAPRT
jgi:hypothetical protein